MRFLCGQRQSSRWYGSGRTVHFVMVNFFRMGPLPMHGQPRSMNPSCSGLWRRSTSDMSPKVKLANHLTLDEIKACYQQASDRVEARRWHLLQLVAQQWSIKKAAEIVGLSYDYAKEIIRRYNRDGPAGLQNRNRDRPTPPPRSLLTREQQEELRQLLQHPAPNGGPWTGAQVAEWIARKTQRPHVWPQRGWEYLRRLQPPQE